MQSKRETIRDRMGKDRIRYAEHTESDKERQDTGRRVMQSQREKIQDRIRKDRIQHSKRETIEDRILKD